MNGPGTAHETGRKAHRRSMTDQRGVWVKRQNILPGEGERKGNRK